MFCVGTNQDVADFAPWERARKEKYVQRENVQFWLKIAP